MLRSAPAQDPTNTRTLLEEMGEVYDRPEFFREPNLFFRPPEPARVLCTHRTDLPRNGAVIDLAYRSTFAPHLADYRHEYLGHVENMTAHARWFRASPTPRATMICLHGWGAGAYFIEERSFVVRYWLRAGLDVILFQLPFHGHRAPKGTRSGALFPTPHVVRTNEAFAHAVHDLRALLAWLKDRDVPSVGLFGMSLGGYTTALMASLEPDLSFAVPMIPASSMSELMWKHGEGTRARRLAEEAGVTQALLDRVFRVHTPLFRPPVVPHERRFVIAGRGDRVTGPDQAMALWAHWDRPKMYWFPGAHVAQVGRGDAFRALRHWLRDIGVVA